MQNTWWAITFLTHKNFYLTFENFIHYEVLVKIFYFKGVFFVVDIGCI